MNTQPLQSNWFILTSPDQIYMWKPDESLDDFIVKPPQEATAKPPRYVRLHASGEKETLRPLTRRGLLTAAERVANAYRALWFRRLVAVGSGALVVIALVLISAILIGINEPAAGPDVAINNQSEGMFPQTEEPFSPDALSASSFAPVTPGIDILRSSIRRTHSRQKVRLIAHKPRLQTRPPELPEEPKFVPTTLVIYAENGVINTRVEPWLQVAYKKPTMSND